MSELETAQMVGLIGWLILAGGALASYKLEWKTGLRMALIWACIFVTVYLFFSVIQ